MPFVSEKFLVELMKVNILASYYALREEKSGPVFKSSDFCFIKKMSKAEA